MDNLKRKPNCKYTIEQESLMVSDYKMMGATIQKISEVNSCSREKVRLMLKAYGVTTRGRIKK